MKEKKQVLSSGVSDLRTSVFTELYEKSSHKPDSIQVFRVYIGFKVQDETELRAFFHHYCPFSFYSMPYFPKGREKEGKGD